MEDTDQGNSDEIIDSGEEQRALDIAETRLKSHERLLKNFTIIGAGMSGNADDGFEYNPAPDSEVLFDPDAEE